MTVPVKRKRGRPRKDDVSSVKKGRPFKFQVGVGQVIRAWDEGMT